MDLRMENDKELVWNTELAVYLIAREEGGQVI